MANPVKGEVPLEIGGKRYVFVLGSYGLAALERRVKMPWFKFFRRATVEGGDWGIDDVLASLHAGLLKHHPYLTEMDVADLIDEAGLATINKAIIESIALMQPDGGGGEVAGNPPTKGNGFGIGSSATG